MSELRRDSSTPPPGGHVREDLPSYLAGGLDEARREEMGRHLGVCAECAGALEELAGVDEALAGMFAGAVPGTGFEDRVIGHLRENSMQSSYRMRIVRRVGWGVAAAIALGATGVLAEQVVKKDLLSGAQAWPERLVAMADLGKMPWEGKGKKEAPERKFYTAYSFDRNGSNQNGSDTSTSGGTADAPGEKNLPKVTLYNGEQASVCEGGKSTPTGGARDGLVEVQEGQKGKLAVGAGVSTNSGLVGQTTIDADGEARKVTGLIARYAEVARKNDELNQQLLSSTRSIRRLQEEMATREEAAASKTSGDTGRGEAAVLSKVPGLGRMFADQKVTPGDSVSVPDGGTLQIGGQTLEGGKHDINGLVMNQQTTPKAFMSKSDPAAPGSGPVGAGGQWAPNSVAPFDIVMVPARGLTTNQIDGTATYSGTMTKSGSGTLALSGVNTYTGGTTISGGTVAVTGGTTTVGGLDTNGNNVSMGSGTVSLNGGTLQFDGPSGYTKVNNGTLTVNSGGTIGASGGMVNARTIGSTNTISLGRVGTGDATIGNLTTGNLTVGGNIAGKSETGSQGDSFMFNQLKLRQDGDMQKEGTGSWDVTSNPNLRPHPDDWVELTRIRIGEGKTPGPVARLEQPKTPVAVEAEKPDGATPQAAPLPPRVARPVNLTAVQLAARKIIRNGTVEYEVRSFDEAYDRVWALVEEEGGIIAATNSDRLPNGKMSGNITVRVAPENLDRLVLKLRGIGELKNQQIGSTDVTKAYTDLESELRALRAMEERLILIIKSGKGQLHEILDAERQLGDYRGKIEKIEGEIRYYNNLVGLATLNIKVYEKDIRQPAAATETEAVTMAIETEDVEAKYADARKFIAEAKGRIVESELKRYEADQLNARIVCDVPQEQADHLTVELKQLGRVARLDRDKRVCNDGTTAAPAQKIEQKDTRLMVSLYNLANIAPREVTVLTVAAGDVDGLYRKVLAAVRKEVQPEKDGKPAVPAGKVLSSSENGQKPELMTADIRADVRADQADAIVEMIRAVAAPAEGSREGKGEVLASNVAVNSDTANSTSAKRGIQLRIVAFASVPPREVVNITAAATNVSELYEKMLKVAQKLETAGAVQILRNNLAEPTAGNANATLDVNLARAERTMFEDLLTEAGVLTRTLEQAQDGAFRTDSKIAYRINLVAADALPAVRTTTLTVEVADVAAALGQIRGAYEKSGAREIDSTAARTASGDDAARLTVEMPAAKGDELVGRARALGQEKMANVVRNQGVPEGKLSRERLELSLVGAASLRPVRTTTLMIEAADVSRAAAQIREAIAKHGGQEIDSTVSHTANGDDRAHVVAEIPSSQADDLLASARGLGVEKTVNVVRTPGVSESKLSRDRVDVTIASRQSLLGEEKGLGDTTYAALSSAARWLVASLYFLVSGTLFLGPWVFLVWVVYRLMRRGRKVKAT